MRTSLHNQRKGAFTLVEMVTVIGIIALLVALAAPSLMDVIRSTRLNAAGDGLVNRLSLAQQSAVSLNAEVELRFYRYVDSNTERPNDNSFYAYQVVQNLSNGDQKALSEPYYLESGIVLSSQNELSPLLTTTNGQAPINGSGEQFLFNPPGGTAGSEVNYASMRFYPDGSMRMLTGSTNAEADATETAIAYTVPAFNQSFVTVIESKDSQSTQAPQNYYCIQIDSYTGRTRVYRP